MQEIENESLRGIKNGEPPVFSHNHFSQRGAPVADYQFVRACLSIITVHARRHFVPFFGPSHQMIDCSNCETASLPMLEW